ncbi:hypothetical protein HY489_04215 [Candidatus Woesearchaeota archaeon]|nr:hypothetical protein [Candidatus Woesearchaeota archaeon]
MKRGQFLSPQFLVILVVTALAIGFGIYGLVKVMGGFAGSAGEAVAYFDVVVQSVKNTVSIDQPITLFAYKETDKKPMRLYFQSPDADVQVGKCPRGVPCMCVLADVGGKPVEKCEVLAVAKEKLIGEDLRGFSGMARCPVACRGEVVCIPNELKRIDVQDGQKLIVGRDCNTLFVRVA